jgi:hypothetical protein
MKELTPSLVVDVDAEIEAMAKYLGTRWDSVPDLVALFQAIRVEVSRTASLWFEQYAISDYLRTAIKARKSLLEPHLPAHELSLVRSYDAPTVWLSELEMQVHDLHDNAQNFLQRWDFSERVRAVHREVAKQFSWLADAKPKGWAELRKNYVDFDGQGEYAEKHQLADEAAFEGINSDSAGAPGFPGRTALPYVMYDEVCQGRKAPYVLVSAAFAHLNRVQEHNNTQAFIAALKALDLGLTVPSLVFEQPAPVSSNVHVNGLLWLVQHDGSGPDGSLQPDYESSLQALKNYDALSDAEKAARKAESAKAIQKLLAELNSESKEDTAKREEKAKARFAGCQAHLQQLTGRA